MKIRLMNYISLGACCKNISLALIPAYLISAVYRLRSWQTLLSKYMPEYNEKFPVGNLQELSSKLKIKRQGILLSIIKC